MEKLDRLDKPEKLITVTPAPIGNDCIYSDSHPWLTITTIQSFLKIPVPRPPSIPNNSECVDVGPWHQCFFKAPQVIPLHSQVCTAMI